MVVDVDSEGRMSETGKEEDIIKEDGSKIHVLLLYLLYLTGQTDTGGPARVFVEPPPKPPPITLSPSPSPSLPLSLNIHGRVVESTIIMQSASP